MIKLQSGNSYIVESYGGTRFKVTVVEITKTSVKYILENGNTNWKSIDEFNVIGGTKIVEDLGNSKLKQLLQEGIN